MPSKNDLKKSPPSHLEILVCLFLVVTTIAVYWQIRHYDFVNYDDDTYVTENPRIQNGITLEGIVWAFATIHASNWHPLTWLSHMLDCQLFGLTPGKHHLINLLFHIANTLLLFFVFRKMTGRLWQSAFIAALFALHPLNVESVAWISERKNLLSAFFCFLTTWCYIRYVAQPSVYRYLLVMLFFTFGLMSKPMLVTLPCLLLLLDFWPLCRFRFQGSGDNSKTQQKSTAFHLVLEKVPLFFLVAISILVTVYAQKQVGALASLDAAPLNDRLANALVSYVSYIGKMIYPFKLAVLYPYPITFPWWKVGGAALILVSISFLAIKTIRKRPYFTVGWLWYLGTLVPVIGLVQVGSQSMADRYTYIPLIGLFIIIAWGAPELLAKWRHKKICLVATASVFITFFVAVTWRQVGYWKNSITLFKHALQVTSNNFIAHNNLGLTLYGHGQTDAAIKHYLQALQINPYCANAHYSLGLALYKKGKIDDAIKQYSQALRINPHYAYAHYNLGIALYQQGKIDDAIKQYLQALRIEPDRPEIHFDLGLALYKKGKIDDAIKNYSQALKIMPDFFEAHNNLASALYQKGETDNAIKQYLQALRIQPNCPEVYNNLGVVFTAKGDFNRAISCFYNALSIKPDYLSAKNNLKKALALKNKSVNR